MKRYKIIHNNIKYQTFKSFELYIRDIIYKKIGLCSSVKKTKYYDELISILERHPEREEKFKKIKDIEIVRNTLNKKALEINIINDDNTKTDISWRICIKGEQPTQHQKLRAAFRTSISQQILNFRNSNYDRCCKLCNKKEDLHIDHIILFEKLVQDFLKGREDIPNNFSELQDQTHRTCFKKEDIKIEKDFYNFHLENAKLRYLCKKCNLGRSKIC